MRFDELEKKLNEMIEGNKELQSASRFNSKDNLKKWLKDTIKEIVGEELIRKDWEDKGDKFDITYDYNGRYNCVDIKYKGYQVAEVTYKYTYTSGYSGIWSRYTSYGIKSVKVNVACICENSKDFESAKEEVRKRDEKNIKDHNEYVEKNIKRSKELNDKLKEIGMSIEDIEKEIGELKYFYRNINWEEKRRFSKEVLGKEDNSYYWW